MRPVKKLLRKQAGIALITTLLLLLLMSAMIVGFVLLVTEGQRLSGMNNDQSRAFYGAEAGMEKLTADLGTLFGNTYAPTGAQVDALESKYPVLPSSTPVTFVDAQGNNSYSIDYPKDANGNPKAAFAQITSGSSPYQGMTALETPYTLTVGARTSNGAEVKLQRTTQTVGIPLFQFGIYSETDLSFFPGPNFDFGGRVHTNGNLFLNSGGPAGAINTDIGKIQLWLRNPVTAAKDIFRDCLSNTHAESATGTHPGSVEITKGGGSMQTLGFGQGSLTSCLNSTPNTAVWRSVSASFNGNLRSGVTPLNLAITLLGNGASQPIDLIRRPVVGELGTNAGVLGERYFSEASLRILLSDTANDITGLDCVSPGAPFNLADLALPAAGWVTANATALKAKMVAAGTTPLPLAASGAAGGALPTGNYTSADGYWQVTNTPIITGFIKIDVQTAYGSPCGTYKDVTQEVLSFGYAGRNINPVPQSLDGVILNPMWGNSAAYLANMALGKSPALSFLPSAEISGQNNAALGAGNFTAISTNAAPTGVCKDPHPNAIIRLERIRDNPSSVNAQTGALKPTNPLQRLPVQSTVAEACGVDPATNKPLANLRASATSAPLSGAAWVPLPSDFWPNVLYDTREGYNRQPSPTAPSNSRITLGGTMHYIELDVKNLARWFSGTMPVATSAFIDTAVAPNNFVVYVSDRRSNYVAPGTIPAAVWPPASPSGHETGEFGYGDFINSGDIKGCPDGALETGEDLDSNTTLFNYGATSFPRSAGGGLKDSTGLFTADTLFQSTGTAAPGNALAATVADPLCVGPNAGFPWPRTFLLNPNEGRENPPALFRRALKLVNGSVITLPVCPGGVTCGLTVATENPAYVQGDYNANSAGGNWGDPSVAAAVIADAFTLLSSDWNDVNSFSAPFCASTNAAAVPPCPFGRDATVANNWYRLGVVAGKSKSFNIPAWDTTAIDGSQDFGTDGGVHNFMRFLENWNGTLNYQGSIISLYYNRQAIGLFNSGNNNYNPPNRGYQFDTNFLDPKLLPPRTPMFRDINTTGFTQLLLPTQ
jgi:hypothetical protein